MSDSEEFFIRKNGAEETQECAFVWRGIPADSALPFPIGRYVWSEAGKAFFERIHHLSRTTGKPEGRELPYSSLRAVLQARLKGVLLIQHRLLRTKNDQPLFVASGQAADVLKEANRAVAAWCQITLLPWAERLALDVRDVVALETRARDGAIVVEMQGVDPSSVPVDTSALTADFHDFSDPMLAIVAARLDGIDLFPGLGPVSRIVDSGYGNSIQFETWPTVGAKGEDLFSMVATMSVETRPSSQFPYLVVRASKRIWCREFPKPGQLYGRRNITVRIARKDADGSHSGVAISVGLAKGEPVSQVDLLMFEASRSSGTTIDGQLGPLIKNRGDGPTLFVGVPFRYGYYPVPKIEAGVTLQDQMDLTAVVGVRLEGLGFSQSRSRVIEATYPRPDEFHVQATLHNLITHHFGHVNENEVPACVEELFGAPERKSRGPDKPVRTVDLASRVDANRKRLDDAFGKDAPIDLIFICRREGEDTIFRSVVALLFGDRVRVVRFSVPEGVHGTQKNLDGEVRRTRSQRAAIRRQAWTGLAEQIKAEHPDRPVIVQVAREYDGLDEDTVNKDVGRNTLATIAGCSVQYLLPPGDGRAAEYMHRVQAALYDLLFAHSGLGPVPAPAIVAAFPEANAPKTILGISIVSQAASRRGRPEGAELAVALKIDAATGKISGRFGRALGRNFDAGEFLSLSETLTRVAAAGTTSLGADQIERRKHFMTFVRSVVDEIAAEDPNALVMFDSTNAVAYWRWLNDASIGHAMFLEERSAPAPRSWNNLRIVRVREGSAGRVGILKSRSWQPVHADGSSRDEKQVDEIYATSIERLVESLPEGSTRARHYLAAHGFGMRNRGARGQSTYRSKDGFVSARVKTPKGRSGTPKVLFKRGINTAWDKPSRLPIPLEITIPSTMGGKRDAGDTIAGLISSLRNGYSHTADGTFLPAPLSFRSKILDYMDRYGTGPEGDPTEPPPEEEFAEAPDDAESAAAEEDASIGFADVKRWFEGTADFDDFDIPAFEGDSDGREENIGRTSPFEQLPDQSRHRRDHRAREPSQSATPTFSSPESDNMFSTARRDDETESAPASMALPQDSDPVEVLLEAIRSPSAPLPTAIDAAFLADILHFVNADVRKMHEDREWIRSVTGFPWPEEKPSTEDMPALYADALRYPSFAIAVQHLFLGDTYRGLPKNQTRLQLSDLYKRARKERPSQRHERRSHVLQVLNALEFEGDLNLALADLVSTPGHFAWNMKCSKATNGLDRLEANEKLAPAARYLRHVLGPFKTFGEEATIREVFESTVIPQGLRRPKVLAPAYQFTEAPILKDDSDRPRAEMDTVAAPLLPVSAVREEEPIATSEAASLRWSAAWSLIVELGQSARSARPSHQPLHDLRAILEELENVRSAFDDLSPKLLATAEVRELLRLKIAEIIAGLEELHGETFGAHAVLSDLSEIPDHAPPSAVQGATECVGRIEMILTATRLITVRISDIEASLPKMKAKAEIDPLINRYDELLREALGIVRSAAALLPRLETVAGPSHPHADDVEKTEPKVSATHAPSATIVGEDDPTDASMGEAEEPYDPEAKFESQAPRAETAQIPETPADPLYADVVARLDKLFALGEFGLAYHLRAASSQIMGDVDLPYTPAELRLASAAGRTVALSGQDHFSLADQRGEALSTAQSLADAEDDRSLARRNLLLAGAIPAALFRADDVAAVSLVEIIGGKGRFANYFKLVQTVDENRKRGFLLTPANVLAIEAHSRDDSYVADSVASIKQTIEGFRQSRFRFVLGEKIKHALTQPQGLLGRLGAELTATDVSAARTVAEQLDGREKSANFLGRVATDIGTGQDIDGAARERLLNLLSDIGVSCGDLARTVDGLASLRQAGGRLDAIKRLRDLALSGIDDVLADAEIDGSLFGASKIHSTAILKSVASLLRGGGVERDVMPLAVGLHAPLLWLPKLIWTGSWMPSPYDAERIVQEIMSLDVPLLADPARSIRDAFEKRLQESAFVPAYMLLNASRWLGFDKEEAARFRSRLDTDKEIKKSQVSERLNVVRRLVERMRRMAVGPLEQSARLAETLSTINPDRLPVELPSSFLPETLEGDRVEDFNSASARIDSVEFEAERAFETVTKDYAAQIEELKGLGSLDEETEGELRSLLGKREFTTLADWLNMLRTGGVRKPQLPSGVINKRLAWYRSVLPDLGTLDPNQAARAVDAGGSIGVLNYGNLDGDRREEGAKILRIFPELKRLVKDTKSANADQIRTKTMDLASALLYDVVDCKADDALSRVGQQIRVFDARVTLPPFDSNTLVLPEFGSATQGSWRICVVTPTIPQQGMIELANLAGSRGVVVLYLGVLGKDRREQMRVELNKRKRAMLVIDEALAAATISDREDRRRAVIEIAQGYSGADPYKDHGKSAVPPEMFKGRIWEQGEITSPAGSYIVYGGRRLGKTALLQQIHSLQPAHAIFAYVDLDVVGDASEAFEQMSKKIGDEVFRAPVRSGEAFSLAIAAWLDGDQRRRLLLLIDEADRFVKSEAASDFICVQTMLRLMADTKHRFKFVLAGLHNVSRIVRAENSPLVQISSNPLQIGPLLNRDVDDAEFLVRGPFAAMGFEFDRREDVWRILSFTNYYPVLIQVFCKELLGLIHEQVQQTGRVPASIGTALVERALNSSEVKSKLFASFERTIASIESRYELITYILAVREVVERDSGMDAEGMSAAEVADRAMECWPAAFPRGSDALEFEQLLEEMEGFGIARRTVSGRFALRSRSLLELMESASSEADLTRKLDSFKKMDRPPNIFDPKNVRARLGKPLPRIDSEGRISPLTDGQEADILSPVPTLKTKSGIGEPTTEAHLGISVIFGTEAAGVQYVEAALLDSKRSKDKLVDIELKAFESKKEMLDEVRKPAKNERPRVIVVSATSPWRPDWVVEAERIGRIRKGQSRLVFVGLASHARTWVSDTAVLKRVLPNIQIVRLRPWARSYLGSRLESLQLPIDLIEQIRSATGGWSEFISPLLDRIGERPSEASVIVSQEAARLQESAMLDKLGIPADLVDFFRELAAYSDGSTITSSDFQYLCSSDGRSISPRVVGAYSDLLGILSFPPDSTSARGQRRVDLNPLLHAILLRHVGGADGAA